MKDFSKASERPWKYSEEPGFSGLRTKHYAIFNHLNQTVLRSNYLGPEDSELIVTAVNNFDKMKEVIGNALANQEQYGYLTDQTQNEIKQLLESIK